MATSGSADFNVTRNDIIRDALLMIGAVDSMESAGATEIADAARMLNMLIKHWQRYPSLWTRKDVTHTLTPGTQSYTVGTGLNINTARPLKVEYCRRKNTSATEVEIDVVSRQEYMSLPTKTTQGAPNLVYYDPQRDNGVLYVWPTGDTTNNQLVLTFRRPIEDFDDAGNNPDFPQEWILALVYNLAAKLLPQYPNPDVAQMVIGEARALLDEMLQHDEESVSFYIKPRRF